MVGGVNYDISNFNRVTQAYRQPGSSINLYVRTSNRNKKILPNTLILDSDILAEQGNNLPVWAPKLFKQVIW